MRASDLFGGPDGVKDQLARAIAAARDSMGISEEQLAREVGGISVDDIIALESSGGVTGRLPSRSKIFRILNVLNESIEDILRMPAKVTAEQRDYWVQRINRAPGQGRSHASTDPSSIPPKGQLTTEFELARFVRARALDEVCQPPQLDNGKAKAAFVSNREASREALANTLDR